MPPDGRFAFVSLEGSGAIAVFNLQRALASHFRTSGLWGTSRWELPPVNGRLAERGLAVRDQRSEPCAPERAGSSQGRPGSLSVISLHKAETDPPHSVVSRVDAGCDPVRVVTSASGGTVWVTAPESDMLLAFSASRLRGDPQHSLIVRVEVGEAPVGWPRSTAGGGS